VTAHLGGGQIFGNKFFTVVKFDKKHIKLKHKYMLFMSKMVTTIDLLSINKLN